LSICHLGQILADHLSQLQPGFAPLLQKEGQFIGQYPAKVKPRQP
jgi:hypothetical protein